MDPTTSQDYQEEMKKYYSDKLKEAAEDISKNYPGLRVETQLMKGRPSSTIVEVAENHNLDLIVMGVDTSPLSCLNLFYFFY